MLRRRGSGLCAAALIALWPALATAGGPEGWHTSMKAGMKAAEQSGKAILYVTAWKPGV